jgi:hypothetical protein
MSREHLENMADRMNVSVRMLRKYIADGMPRNEDGTFDEAACFEWKKSNVFPELKGGDIGGGRPKGIKNPPRLPPTETDGDDAAPVDLRQLKARQVEARIRMHEIEIAKQEGKLIDRDKGLRAVRDHLTVVRQRVERIGPNATKAVAAALGLGAESTEPVRNAIDEEIRRAMGQIADDPFTL